MNNKKKNMRGEVEACVCGGTRIEERDNSWLVTEKRSSATPLPMIYYPDKRDKNQNGGSIPTAFAATNYRMLRDPRRIRRFVI